MRLLREPLLHFAVLGGLLWGISLYIRANPPRPTILMSKTHVAQIGEHYRLQYGSSPTPTQLDALVESDLTEELKYRAALQLGLDKNDEIVRRRLVQKYEFLKQDLGALSPPSEAQLRDYFDSHRAQYLEPPRVTFTHVYFSPDLRGNLARNGAETQSLTLNQRHMTRAPESGDRFPGPTDLVAVSKAELGRIFGQAGLAEEIFSQEAGRWSPPLHSGFGWHTVYVVSRQPGGPSDFANVRDQVAADYTEAARAKGNAAATAKLRNEFKVIRE